MPPGTPLLACTATASRSVKKEVIFYQVKPRTDIDTDFLPLTTLQKEAVCAPRVLVYCQSLDTSADLFAHFLYELGESSYYPPGSPHLSEYRLFPCQHTSTQQGCHPQEPSGSRWYSACCVCHHCSGYGD